MSQEVASNLLSPEEIHETLATVDIEYDTISVNDIESVEYDPTKGTFNLSFLGEKEGAQVQSLPLNNKYVSRGLRDLTGANLNNLKPFGDDQELLNDTVRHLFKKSKTPRVKVKRVDGSVKAIYGPDSSEIQPLQVFDTLVSALGVEKVEPLQNHYDEFFFKLITGETGHPLQAVNDISHVGLAVSVNGKVSAAPYVHRLVCTNGLTTTDVAEQDAVQYGSDGSFNLEVFARACQRVKSASEKMLKSFLETAAIPLENPAVAIDRVASARLGPRLGRKFMDELPSYGAIDTYYDLTNAITAFARGYRSDPLQEQKIQSIGWSAVGHGHDVAEGRVCPSCHVSSASHSHN